MGFFRLLTRGPQVLRSAATGIASGAFKVSDVTRWAHWSIRRRHLPPVVERAVDDHDNTRLLAVANARFWWPTEFPVTDLDVVWGEVFLPFPPNGHAYESATCTVPDRKWVIDAGACEGFFTQYALAKGARVLAVEPVPRLAYCLGKTFAVAVREGNVVVRNSMLGSENGVGRIGVIDSPIGAQPTQEGGEEVPLTTIDTLLREYELTDAGLVKMDIEGAEAPALLGAAETLRRWRPSLSIAVYHYVEQENQVRAAVAHSGVPYAIWTKGLSRTGGCFVRQILHATIP